MKGLKLFTKNTFMALLLGIAGMKYIYADPIDEFGNTYELVLIYSSDCPHCQRFVPIFADVVKHYNIKYDAFTMNGGTLKPVATHTYPANQEIVSNFYQDMQQGVVPAVFIINVNTMDELPISVGEEPEDQFIADINRVASALFAEESGETASANHYVQAAPSSTTTYGNSLMNVGRVYLTTSTGDEEQDQTTSDTDSAATDTPGISTATLM